MSDDVDPIIKWFVEDVHYPFDVTFSAPPPLDHRALAKYWNTYDNWEITDDEAYAVVLAETGLDA